MKTKRLLLLGVLLAVASGAAALVMVSPQEPEPATLADPRLETPRVLVATTEPVQRRERRFTGVIGARVQSDLGFRVSGKIIQRLVDVGEEVRAGQPLMRIDDTDLLLAMQAKRNAVDAARAAVAQLEPDEQRHAKLLEEGWVTRQRYEQVKAAHDAAVAQLAAARADARFAENETDYTTLAADADGTVIETLGERGQVVSAGQPVVRLAWTGPREAVVALPETMRPEIGHMAEATVFGTDGQRHPARLRQLSDSADPRTRTYEARFVLHGPAASAPLGATVTIHLTLASDENDVTVPLGAVLDDGSKTGVWLLDRDTFTVQFRPVKLVSLDDESAVVSGIEPGQPVVALGAHLLQDGAEVRPASDKVISR